MSMRSMLRPSVRNSHPSSWLIVESARPEMTAHRSRTNLNIEAGRMRCRRPPRTASQVVLIDSHTSVETVSRALRADSRALLSAARKLTGEASS